ncbi:hypothetical protein SDRG_10481 [Saprolegnia diclina VS20]|uniref:Apple domain-containing protein n=1 Tax=Saprolegnia diclina (strain VS20) TaxID=1156394 RepID=T0RPR9_SAPDV|nr:hypothetical protein SDRG_10481 [Saprolegnia diclina VS20]EQC31967.1 hypothetical protein SDRG_10481 [Saprolegnia diclina VS20]|eukprot:XP_008614695.1 hypothetical protein SDRG_10481 [Saprolegnia diclina VS20]
MHTSVFVGVLALALQAATALPTCAPIEANVDYWGNDIGRTARTSAADCCADCKNMPGCRLFVWNSHEGGTCWLKSEQGAKSYYPGAKASVINDITVPDQCSAVQEHVDYWGNDVGRTARASASDCCADCASTKNCALFVWNGHEGGTCWLKSKQGAKSFYFGAVSATLAPVSECAAAEENVDYYGNDIGRTARATADNCCDDCKNTPGCQLYVWNHHDGGTCWLKSKKGAKSPYTGAMSATLKVTVAPTTMTPAPTTTRRSRQHPSRRPPHPSPRPRRLC